MFHFYNLNMKRIPTFFFIFFTLIFSTFFESQAQILSAKSDEKFSDSIKKDYDFGPYFGLYKDNYFTVGTTIGNKPTATNSDVKFQVSLSFRLTNATLPWNTYLYLFYTQKCFWNVFENSLPMHDFSFNPGIGWRKPFFVKDRYAGDMTLIVEHESNGKDGPASRSWNLISLSGSALVSDWLMVHGKIWIPIIDSGNNKDILYYAGVWQTGFVLTSLNKKFQGGVTLVKRKGFNLNFNTIVDFSWNINKKMNLNLFAQYYNGFGESLIDYNVFHSMLRVGIVFKPRFFSEF